MRPLARAMIAVASVVVTASSATTAVADDNSIPRDARFDLPYQGFMPASTVLRDSTPQAAGLDPAPIDAALTAVDGWSRPSSTGAHPLYAGAVTLLAHDGKVVTKKATGMALKYADGNGTELPPDQQIPMRTDTIFDLASVSKLFTSIVIVQLIQAGKVDLEAPVASYVPEFGENGKEAIPVRQLLTHTSGLPEWLPLWSAYNTPEERIHAALTTTLKNPPGSTYLYSDINLIDLGVLAERVTDKPLDQLVREGITEPLGMTDTGYNPDPSKLTRIAATEYQANPPRGMVWGSVHDENAWSLGGVAGHAGVFSTADDMAKLAQALLNGGSYRGHRILSADSVEKMITNYNQAFPGNSHGLGFELDLLWYMSGLSGPRTAGHTGYTGTSVVIDFDSRSFAILLTNRVHPSRSWGSNNPARREVAQGLAQALAVKPAEGPSSWYSGIRDASTATLTVPVPVPAEGARLRFDVFVHTENTDLLYLESTSDGGTTWQPVPFEVRRGSTTTGTNGSIGGTAVRQWGRATADLAAGVQQVRWRYKTDSLYFGRGVNVDGVRVMAGDRTILDGERYPDLFTAVGWRLTNR
jgi:CubicO group peptidase (beta-lactamase class C family)